MRVRLERYKRLKLLGGEIINVECMQWEEKWLLDQEEKESRKDQSGHGQKPEQGDIKSSEKTR